MDRGGHSAGHHPVARAGFPHGLATRTARVVTMRTRKMAADG
jgi:hypothetical protein